MAIQNRTVTIKAVFAEDATTTIPTVPVPGISYRDTTTTAQEIKGGWPFKEIVDSSKFNEHQFEMSKIASLFEKYGFLPWSNLTDYEAGSVCLGSNGTLYSAKQSTGPSTTAYDPVYDTQSTYWIPYYKNIMSQTMDLLYPIGSLYIGTQNTCPLTNLISGSTWELVAVNRALWGGDGTNGNTTIEAGLPNITGNFTPMGQANISSSSSTSGAFYFAGNTGSAKILADTSSSYTARFGGASFDASRSSDIYGGSTTVQPPAYRVNVWRRIS